MKKNIITSVLFLFSITFLFIKCSKTPDEVLPKDPVEIDLTTDQVALIESENTFAFDIFKEITENAGTSGNIIISPLSISYALSMTLNGADGTTREAMLEALRVNGITPAEINNSYKNLTEALLTVDKRVIMDIANSVWTEDRITPKQSFIDILEDYYSAESKAFSITDPAAPGKINEWIEENTNGLIKEMIDKLEDNTVMLIINAIYFKGKWKLEFDEKNTEQKPFYKTGGNSSDVPMMNQKEDFKIYDGDGFMLAEFPYGQGNFAMDILLPDANDGVSALLPSLTDAAFSGWLRQMGTRETNVFIPRFKYGFKKKLKDILTDMGMGIAFTEFADFTNITENPPLLINDVTHQAFIETNEEGTEAAAATVVDIGLTSMPQEPLVFKADHPFIYIIRETTTNSIIFMGVVADPLSE
jgi:serine protease inhibitor